MSPTFKHPQGQKNRLKVLRAIFEIGGWVKQEQIKEYLDRKADEYIGSNAQRALLPAEKRRSLRNKQTLSKRAIFDWLQRLKKEGLLRHKDERYALTPRVVLDYAFVAEIYGSVILAGIASIPPHGKTAEERLADAVNRMGVFVSYLLLHILAPPKSRTGLDASLERLPLTVEEKKAISRTAMTAEQLRAYRKSWIDNAIPAELILDVFRMMLTTTIDPETGMPSIPKERELTDQEYQRLVESFQENNRELYDKIIDERIKFMGALLLRLISSKSVF